MKVIVGPTNKTSVSILKFWVMSKKFLFFQLHTFSVTLKKRFDPMLNIKKMLKYVYGIPLFTKKLYFHQKIVVWIIDNFIWIMHTGTIYYLFSVLESTKKICYSNKKNCWTGFHQSVSCPVFLNSLRHFKNELT